MSSFREFLKEMSVLIFALLLLFGFLFIFSSPSDQDVPGEQSSSTVEPVYEDENVEKIHRPRVWSSLLDIFRRGSSRSYVVGYILHTPQPDRTG